MGFSIEEFKGLVSRGGGLAKPNLFNVYLPSLGSTDTKGLNLLCKATSLPGKQMMSQDIQIGLVNRKVANGYAVTDISLTFYMLNDFAVRNYFEKWQSMVVKDDFTLGYYNDYTKTVGIESVQKTMSTSLFKKKLFNSNSIASSLLSKLDFPGVANLSQGEVEFNIGGDNVPVYTIDLLEAYPTSVGDLELTNDAGGIMELTVQLSYKDFRTKRLTPNDDLTDALTGAVIRKLKDLF